MFVNNDSMFRIGHFITPMQVKPKVKLLICTHGHGTQNRDFIEKQKIYCKKEEPALC